MPRFEAHRQLSKAVEIHWYGPVYHKKYWKLTYIIAISCDNLSASNSI